MPEGSKVASKCSELMRRLKNTWEVEGQEEVEKTPTELLDNINGMGYKENWRQEIVKKNLTDYIRILYQQSRGGDPGEYTCIIHSPEKNYRKLYEASNWFAEFEEEEDVKVTLSSKSRKVKKHRRRDNRKKELG